jgi:hypothetical protein
LAPSGEVEVEGVRFPVYQCDECIDPWVVEGETFETCLTFAVGADGKLFNPADVKADD